MESAFMAVSRDKFPTLFVMFLAALSSAVTSASPAVALSESSSLQSASDGSAQEISAVRDDAQSLLRASYQTCIDRSDGVTVEMQECIAREYTYHDDKLNRVYRHLRATLARDAANALRDEQRAWLKRMDAECTRDIKEGGQAARLSANDCRVRRTAQRVAELEAMAAASKSPASSEATANGAIGTDGRLVLALGGSAVSIRADACRSIGAELQHCADGVDLTIANAAGRSQLRLPALYINGRATAYRGALTRPADHAGRSIVLADIDRNGRDDIAVWTGTRGANGAASYDVYLASGKGYALNRELSALTIGKNGLFVLDGGRLVTTSKSGCCIHSVQTYALRGGKPVLIEEVVKDATENPAKPKITTSRLVDGKMRVVDR
jgi:uncharacterized protein YecT (DUF1311 family)